MKPGRSGFPFMLQIKEHTNWTVCKTSCVCLHFLTTAQLVLSSNGSLIKYITLLRNSFDQQKSCRSVCCPVVRRHEALLLRLLGNIRKTFFFFIIGSCYLSFSVSLVYLSLSSLYPYCVKFYSFFIFSIKKLFLYFSLSKAARILIVSSNV